MPDEKTLHAEEPNEKTPRTEEPRRARRDKEDAVEVPVTPTDFPPPPGPQPAPTMSGTFVDGPSHQMRLASEQREAREGESVSGTFLPDGSPMPSNPREASLAGLNAVPDQGQEMGAHAVTEVIEPKVQRTVPQFGNLIDKWLDSKLYKRFGNAIGRGPQDLGLVGQGQVVTGHMILMDANSGECVRVMDGAKIEDDRVLVNIRCLPEWLVNNPEMAKKG
jgi:hypothetical protein